MNFSLLHSIGVASFIKHVNLRKGEGVVVENELVDFSKIWEFLENREKKRGGKHRIHFFFLIEKAINPFFRVCNRSPESSKVIYSERKSSKSFQVRSIKK